MRLSCQKKSLQKKSTIHFIGYINMQNQKGENIYLYLLDHACINNRSNNKQEMKLNNIKSEQKQDEINFNTYFASIQIGENSSPTFISVTELNNGRTKQNNLRSHWSYHFSLPQPYYTAIFNLYIDFLFLFHTHTSLILII